MPKTKILHQDLDLTRLEMLIDRLLNIEPDGDRITMRDILVAVGRRSFGPLVLIAGLITLAPIIGDIPGVPTVIGLFVILTAGQLMFKRNECWLPGWLLNRSFSKSRFQNAMGWLRRPARFLDHWFYPRMTIFFQGGFHAILIASIFIAALMPVMEFVPFSANIAGIAFTAYGLALITRDGLLASLALLITAGAAGLISIGLF